MESLFDAILEADGISKEMLEEQRARVKLLDTLREAMEDDQALDELVQEHREELNYEFFLLLSGLIDADQETGEAEKAEALRDLREKLLERVSPTMPGVAPEDASYEDIIEMLQGVEPGAAWRSAIALNRSRLDYGFFQALTAKIEAAGDQDAVEKLTELRQRILTEIDALNRMTREAQDSASLLIMELSEAEDLEAAVREHRDDISDVFVSVLTRYQEAARVQGDAVRAEKLGRILEKVIDVLEEDLEPEVRLIHKLLLSGYPEGTGAILEEHRGLLDDAFLASYDRYLASLEEREDQELLDRLKEIRAQIVAKIAVLRG